MYQIIWDLIKRGKLIGEIKNKIIIMQRFTKIEKKENKESQPENKYQGKDLNIIEYKEWDIITGKDKVIILPYMKDEGFILLNYENIPTFQYKYKEIEGYKDVFNFLTVVKGDIKDNEKVEQSIRRILFDNCGITLRHNYPITIDKKLFKDEKNTGQYYISLLELNYNDFKQGPLKKSNNDNKIIKLNLGEIDDIKTFDLITDYMLLKLKFDYNIK